MIALLSEWFSAAPGTTVLGVLLLPPLTALLLFGRGGRRVSDGLAEDTESAPVETTERPAAGTASEAPAQPTGPGLEEGGPDPDAETVVEVPEPPPAQADLPLEEVARAAPPVADEADREDELALGIPPAAPAPSLASRLARTSEALVGRLGSLLGGRSVDAEVLEDLEAMLFGADLGVSTADALLEAVRTRASGKDADAVRSVLREEVAQRVNAAAPPVRGLALDGSPHVILVLGVNGSGKTTTIGKLAARYARDGRRVVLGAGDTFRAAAIEQLGVWAERVDCDIVKGQPGGDPASVAFDTVKAAVAREADVAIIDTAGRLQTKEPLIEELRKIVRVIRRDCEGAPHETLLVLDANTGQNAISQARVFTEAAGVTGIVLTKLDGTAKGGVLVGLADEFGIPVRFVGVGEGIDDLRDFDPEEFVEALFAS